MDYITQEDIKEVTWDVVNTFVIPDFESRGHDASGEWKRELSIRAESTRGVISGREYTEYLIRGRGPNKNQDPQAIANWARWYGKNVFAQWVENKNLNLNPYQVAYTIARNGTKIYRDGGSDFLKILETEEVQKFIMDRIGEKIKVRVVNILRNELKEAVK